MTSVRNHTIARQTLLSACGLVIAFLCALIPSEAHAQSAEDVAPIGWAWNNGSDDVFGSPHEACEDQWREVMERYPSSRFVGVRSRSDEVHRVDCVWTRYQYLCPEPGQSGGIGSCGTIIPVAASIVCPAGYASTVDGYCRLAAAREQVCDDGCGDGGKPNPKTGNPVVISTGAKYLEALDYATADGQFRIARQYRSFQVGRPFQQAALPRAPMRGLHGSWNFEFNRELQFGSVAGTPSTPNATVAVLLPDGTGHAFVLHANGAWVEESDAVYASASGNLKLELLSALPAELVTLRDAPSIWRLIDRNDTVWIF